VTTEIAPGVNTLDIVLEDLDGDAIPDLAASVQAPNASDGYIATLFNDGSGTNWTPSFPACVGDFPRDIEAGDLNGNADPDLVTANFSSDDLSVLITDGGFGACADGPFPAGDAPFGVAIADMNNDSHNDVVVCNSLDNEVRVLYGTGSGSGAIFGSVAVISTADAGGNQGSSPVDVKVADLNDDGVRDIVTANFASDTLTILYGNPSSPGTFFSGSFATFVQTEDGPYTLELGDLDGDGDEDIVVGHFSGGGSLITRFNFANQGEAFPTFPAGHTYAVSSGPIEDIELVDLVEVLTDGDLDVLAVESSTGELITLANDGDGRLDVVDRTPVGAGVRSVEAGFLNDDACIDVVATRFDDGLATILLNQCLPGDVDGDSWVTTNDLTFVIFRLGNTGVPGALKGDADGNGVVDTNDLTFVVFRLGDTL